MSVFEKEVKAKIIQEYKCSEGDTGSVHVQCALLTERITYLTQHLKNNKKDHQAVRGLRRLVNQRKKFLKYLKARSLSEYNTLIKRLNIKK